MVTPTPLKKLLTVLNILTLWSLELFTIKVATLSLGID